MSERLLQVRITDSKRAGMAPYNFVPLPESALWLRDSDAKIPELDSVDSELYDGVLHLRLEAATDFFVRGMRKLEGNSEGEIKNATAPFGLGPGRWMLPGASLRGMIRNLVEILSQAPLDPVNDRQLFFRAVGGTPNPPSDPRKESSYEPQVEAYKQQLGDKSSASAQFSRGPVASSEKLKNVYPGYLFVRDGKWFIRPAKPMPDGKKWWRIRTDRHWERQLNVWFRKDESRRDGESGRECTPNERGAVQGAMVCSGPAPGKRFRAHWLLGMPVTADSKSDIPIPEYDVEAYRNGGGLTRGIKDPFEYKEKDQLQPCFFVRWTGRDGKTQHVTFGHTGYLRVPYQRMIREAIPEDCRRKENEARWDLAQAIFGRVHPEGQKGRVEFTDAFELGNSCVVEEREVEIVLGEPKPTTYQHYLTQTSERAAAAITWDGDSKRQGIVEVRGHKGYWHRPGAEIRLPNDTEDSKNNKAKTRLRVCHKGAVFQAAVHFRRLRSWELGALLMAIELPSGCAHKLGMGKPLGLGSFRVSIGSVTRFDRKTRYERMFADSANQSGVLRLEEGSSPADAAELKRDFVGWISKALGLGVQSVEDFWRKPRMVELKHLLKLDGLPGNWNNRTRYLEFGKLTSGGFRNLNEYQTVFPDDRTPHRRRPLPSPSQVVKGDNVPAENRPPFEARTVKSLRK